MTKKSSYLDIFIHHRHVKLKKISDSNKINYQPWVECIWVPGDRPTPFPDLEVAFWFILMQVTLFSNTQTFSRGLHPSLRPLLHAPSPPHPTFRYKKSLVECYIVWMALSNMRTIQVRSRTLWLPIISPNILKKRNC